MRKPLCLFLLTILATALTSASLAAEPGSFGTLNSGISLFAASDDEAGLELWRSDGTSAGTFRLTDDACGEYCEFYSYFFAPWIVAGNRAFIYAQENEVSTLWVTDGSRDGTFPVYEGTRISNLQRPVWVKRLGLLFFVVQVSPSAVDYELWRSDGTPEGTRKVETFVSADTRSGVQELTEFQGRAFFNGQDPVHGPALWSSDGTEAGTVLVRDFFRDDEGAGPIWLRAVGSRLLFLAPSPTSGTVLWASDGTPAGTRKLRALQSGQNNYETIYDVRVAEGLLFLSASNRLWVSDGTRAGTHIVKSGFGSPPILSLQSLFKGRYYFEAQNDDFGFEVWSWSPSRHQVRVLDVCPGSCSSVLEPGTLAVAGDRLSFTAYDGVHGSELWQTDGTAQGTRMVRDINPGFDSSGPGPVHVVAGRALFFAADATGGRQLWRTDGTKKGTIRLTDFVARDLPEELVSEIPGALLFRVQGEPGGDELWVSDGTRSGTRRLETFQSGE